VRTAYNQWTQFEEFRASWKASGRSGSSTIAGSCGGRDRRQEKSWEAEITEQIPDARIAWRSRSGADNAGVVTFHRLDDEKTRVMLQLDYDPEGVIENVGDVVGVTSARVSGDLERFKEFIEQRGRETGGWRGSINPPHS
jgi:hypothetical protein